MDSNDRSRDELSKNSEQQDGAQITRRIFIANGIAIASTLVTGRHGAYAKTAVAAAPTKAKIDVDALKKKIKGEVFTPASPDFKKVTFDTLWNKLYPNRHPDLIVRVKDDKDVVEAINFARANKMKVTVRGGGHNWCFMAVRNSGMQIDLSNMTELTVDPDKKKAAVQPINSNRDTMKALNAHGLAFPTGHCPQVKMSGYLLSGGMSWNQSVWGHGVESVDAIEMVTAKGELITASRTQNQDLFWAARGAGPGFFGVCTRYHLNLHPMPKSIWAAAYTYEIEHVGEIAEWLGKLAPELPHFVELSLFMVKSPKSLEEKTKAGKNKVCMVTASCFADTEEENKKAIKRLEERPVFAKCLEKSINASSFPELFDMSGGLWPENRRNKVDAMFSVAKPKDVFLAVKDHYLEVPGPETVLMFAFFTGKVADPPADAAFSMKGNMYGGPWTMWSDPKEDAVNEKWHAKAVTLLKPLMNGHYIAETDTVTYENFIKDSFSNASWTRLAELRKKHDPDGLFFTMTEGLT